MAKAHELTSFIVVLVLRVLAVAASCGFWQLQSLMVASDDRTWLGSLEGGCGSVNPRKELRESESMAPVASTVVVAAAL
jgi:hypothetical protein